MDEYVDILEVYETDDYEVVNQYLQTGEWVYLGIASGQAEDLAPKFLWALGRVDQDQDGQVPELPTWE